MQIRNVAPEDFHRLAAFDTSPLPQLRSGELRLFVSWCAPLSFVLVDEAGDIRGMALAMRDATGTIVFLHYLVVEQALRGQSWGARLLQRVESAAADMEATAVVLYTRGAASYYLERGYVVALEPVPDAMGAPVETNPTGQYLSKSLAVCCE